MLNKPKYFNASTISKLHKVMKLLLNDSFIKSHDSFISLLCFCNNYIFIINRISHNYFIKKIKPEDAEFLFKSILVRIIKLN